MRVRRALIATAISVVALASLGGCGWSRAEDEKSGRSSSAGLFGFTPRTTVPAGTPITVRLTSTLSSETAHEGDPWTGVVLDPVTIGDREAVPAGSPVEGMVAGAREAERGTRAMLVLAVERISVDGESRRVKASAQPVIAGSTRARNLGAIAGGAAAGALIGKAVGGDGRDAAVGGLIGGATATGVVAASKGYQVVLKAGTVMRFTVSGHV